MAKKNTLEEIIAESVIDNVLQKAREDGLLLVNDGGRERVVGLFVNTDSIGGLSKKQGGDEARGRFINAVKSSQITVFGTQELLQNNELVLVPNQEELEMLLEYEFLLEQDGEDVLFEVVYLNEDGSIEHTGHEITLNEVDERFANEEPLIQVLESDAEEVRELPSEEPRSIDETIYEAEHEDEEDYDEVEHDVDHEEVESDEYEEDDEEDYDATDDVQLEEEDYDDYVVEVAPSHKEEELRKRVYTDIDLSVDMAGFKQAFGNYNVKTLQLMNDRKPGENTDWLVGQVNLMVANANDKLRALRSANETKLSSFYSSVMNEGMAKILDNADYHTEGGLYNKALSELADSSAEKEALVESDINNRHREMDAEYEEAKEIEIDNLVHTWKQNYDNLNKGAHQARKDAYETNRRLELQASKEDAHRALDEKRTSDVYATARQYELKVESLVQEKYAECLEEERKVYAEELERIQAFIDENRKDDIARAEALRQELALQNDIAKLEQEHAQKIESLKAEMQLAVANAETNRKAEEASFLRKLAEKDDNIARLVKDKESLAESAKSELEDVLRRHKAELDAKEERHVQELERVSAQADSWKADAQHQYAMNKRGVFWIIAIAGLIAVAVAFIGFLLGMQFQANNATKVAQTVVENVEHVATVVSSTLQI